MGGTTWNWGREAGGTAPNTKHVLRGAGEVTAASVDPSLAAAAPVGGTSPRDVTVANATRIWRAGVWALAREEKQKSQ